MSRRAEYRSASGPPPKYAAMATMPSEIAMGTFSRMRATSATKAATARPTSAG